MPEFAWPVPPNLPKARRRRNGVMEGRSDAAVRATPAAPGRERGLTPITRGAATCAGRRLGRRAARPARKPRGRCSRADVLAFTSELAIMLRAGLALDNALRVLIEMSHKPSVASCCRACWKTSRAARRFSRALAAHRDLFGDFYINMVRSGEASGQMSQVLERLVEHMERMRALRESVISATMYPAILLGVAVLSLVGMLGFVVPQFERLFKDMGDALPLPTRIVMATGQGFTPARPAAGHRRAVLGWLA
jgi:general secretion pathway protein F